MTHGTAKAEGKNPNALITEKSPYLLQHAYNPVHWYPWGKEALTRAREEDKPIFLSIGYSTCHWCHVMARESFEDPRIAEILNTNFICIKVDREERPELDSLYMKAVQMLAGTGGWPLSVFLTPELKPFYGGTYFPPEPRHGLPAFKDLLHTIINFWHDKRERVEHDSEEVAELLRRSYQHKSPAGAEELSADLLANAYEQLILQFDTRYGGFGAKVAAWSVKTPKFPLPSYLSFLLRYYHRTKEAFALNMVTKTLYGMAQGGIFDQLGGGFHRYSTDTRWLVPHFEKMLYDNAFLARVYLEAYQVTGTLFFARIASETLDWVMREMRDSEGGFYAAVDADSEGIEGAFYVWDPTEIQAVLGETQGEALCRYFGVTPHGNFERKKSVLYIAEPPDEVAEDDTIRAGKIKLLEARNKRIRPATDDKIITSWNGFMISACAIAYQVLHEPRFLDAATAAARFILQRLRRDDGLLRRYRDGEASIHGTLEDYAALIAALLDLYEASFEPQWLHEALRLNDRMLELFWDKADGAFFFNPARESELPTSIKEAYDGPIPSGNSIAAQNLLRLAALTGTKDLENRAKEIFCAFRTVLEESPLEHAQMLCALEFYLSTPTQIVLATEHREAVQPFATELNRHFLPHRVVVYAHPEVTELEIPALVPLIKDKIPIHGQPTVYICENYTCKRPITELEELRRVVSHDTY
ncbi:MAG: thioredoxin domain-containing protein [Methanophagales archaeon ANME-1-THS]|nr:MAG: thioredoxin domain-containing protein [Methanophagales archaeon ANME-1-THS]